MVEQPFASADDLQDRWRPLSTDEFALAQVKIGDASDMIRERWPDVDARILAGTLRESSVVRVVAAMVKRSMSNANEGVESSAEQAGPFGHTVKFANPEGNLYLTADEVRVLDGAYTAPGVVMGWLI